MVFYILAFAFSIYVLYWIGPKLIESLLSVARYFQLREFIVAFFVVAAATSLTNLFVGIASVLNKVPQLSFGDIMGGNLVDMTLVIALIALFSKDGISTKSKMVQGSVFFVVIIAILPLLLSADGVLSRIDGLVLLSAFFAYTVWIFSEEERFRKIYNGFDQRFKTSQDNFFGFLKSSGKIIIFLVILLLASMIIVKSAQAFSSYLNIPITLVGVIIVGLGNCFPETYASFVSVKKKQGWMVLGTLMGSVVICATMVLGIVALLSPIKIEDFSPLVVARVFTIISALFFILVIRTDSKLTKREAAFLIFLYVAFLVTEIFKPYLF